MGGKSAELGAGSAEEGDWGGSGKSTERGAPRREIGEGEVVELLVVGLLRGEEVVTSERETPEVAAGEISTSIDRIYKLL